ncbi:MAG: Hpt domain-containing protein [Pirellulaceae bacterium]
MKHIYDRAGSLNRMGGDEALFREMVGLLREDAPRWLAELHGALQDSDLSRARRAAHTLKGLAANFGASRAMAAAAEMERLVKTETSEGMPGAETELEEALLELVAALDENVVARDETRVPR